MSLPVVMRPNEFRLGKQSSPAGETDTAFDRRRVLVGGAMIAAALPLSVQAAQRDPITGTPWG